MLLNKLLVTLAFSMLFGSGVAVASNDDFGSFKYNSRINHETSPFEVVYICMEQRHKRSILKLPESERYAKTQERGVYLNFMKDGGFIFETDKDGILAETYGPVTSKKTYLRKKARTVEMRYTDLGDFHKFVLTGGNLNGNKGFISTVMLDKDVMIGTMTYLRTWKGATVEWDGVAEEASKTGFVCEQVYRKLTNIRQPKTN
jgi:hypothetical protein